MEVDRLCLAMLVLSACGDASVSAFRQSRLELEMSADGQISLELGDVNGDCPTLGTEAEGSINGIPLALVFAGGEVQTSAGWSCQPPRFAAAAPSSFSGADAVAEIHDATGAVRIEARNVFAARLLELVPTRSSTGQGWALRWVPETDVDRTVSWRLEGASGTVFGLGEVDGDLVMLELPASLAGYSALRADGQAFAPVVRCEGVASCTVRVAATSGEIWLGGGTTR